MELVGARMYKSWSQAGQDLFVIEACKYKKNGTFVEIGAMHSSYMSNTYLLETEFDWSGVSFEIDPLRAGEFNENRKTRCIIGDATVANYASILKENNLPETIDYLQVDIEPASQSLQALEAIMSTGYRFRTITFEHDLYVDPNNQEIKDRQKNLLFCLGYSLYKENVCWDKEQVGPFEDWWILESLI
jgi:hypothetical protein